MQYLLFLILTAPLLVPPAEAENLCELPPQEHIIHRSVEVTGVQSAEKCEGATCDSWLLVVHITCARDSCMGEVQEKRVGLTVYADQLEAADIQFNKKGLWVTSSRGLVTFTSVWGVFGSAEGVSSVHRSRDPHLCCEAVTPNSCLQWGVRRLDTHVQRLNPAILGGDILPPAGFELAGGQFSWSRYAVKRFY